MVALEFVLRYRFVSPFMMAFLVVAGWYDVLWTYSYLLVVLMCVLMI